LKVLASFLRVHRAGAPQGYPLASGMPDLRRYDNRSFDRGASTLKEGLWHLCQGFFFQPLWYVPSPIRVFWLRLFGARIGRGVIVRAGVNIHFPWRLEVGDHVWIGEDAMLLSLAPIRIGSNVCISQRAMLCTGSHEFRKETFDLVTRPVVVEEGAWIAAQAFVGPGVTVGAGSVVAAGAVVVRDVPAGHRARGNPAVIEPVQTV
jgi:putative colanic acid biosynthesis acetyltransferase WcaF